MSSSSRTIPSFFSPRKRQRTMAIVSPPRSNISYVMGEAASYRIGSRPNRRSFRRGFNRTGGFYGRFGPGGELKHLDTAVALNNLTAGAGQVSTSLVAIPQDDTESGRDGRQVIVKRVSIRGTFISDPTTVNPELIRLLLVQDTQTNGAASTVLNVLQTDAVNSFHQLENSHRYKIHMDTTFTTQKHINTAGTSSITTIKFIKFSKALNMIMDYDSSAATGAIATQRSNGLFLIAMSASTITCDFSATVRIRFQDK